MKTLLFKLFLPALGVFFLYMLLLGDTGLLSLWSLRQSNAELQSSIDSLEKVISKKEREIKRIRTDTSYLEELSRTRLGMSKKGEKVFRFVFPDSLQKE